jgi:hypothetical protein
MSTFLLPDALWNLICQPIQPLLPPPPLKPKGLACQTGASLTGILFVLG